MSPVWGLSSRAIVEHPSRSHEVTAILLSQLPRCHDPLIPGLMPPGSLLPVRMAPGAACDANCSFHERRRIGFMR